MLNLVDIYCGAGGLSAGFANAVVMEHTATPARFRIIYALDRDRDCMQSFRRNHFSDLTMEEQEQHAPCRSVVGLSASTIISVASTHRIDIVVGGPNCQGVSTAGLRNPEDKRNEMFREFLRLIAELNPSWFVMENVPGLTHANNRSLLREILEAFCTIGYDCEADVLLAADYGIPQLRYRLFLIGNRIGRPIRFPHPTHEPPRTPLALEEKATRSPFRTVRDAIEDLEEPEPIMTSERADGFLLSGHVANHVIWNIGEENLKRISHVGQGQDWRAMPVRLLPARNFATRASDQVGSYGRLSWDRPAYTITGAAGNVTAGVFIHPSRDRPISAREAARLQGFDDSYVFSGKVQSVYRQIGNAVPPPLAEAVATSILGCHYDEQKADEFGRPGRVTLDLLRGANPNRSFPVLTPRHPTKLRVRKSPPHRLSPVHVLSAVAATFEVDPKLRRVANVEELERLELEARFPRYVRAARRATAILEYFTGGEIEAIARKSGVSPATIEKWVSGFQRGGVEGWRAYHTPVERMVDAESILNDRLKEAISRARTRIIGSTNAAPKDAGNSSHGNGECAQPRSHMNPYLQELVNRFGHLSVWDLLELAEDQLGTSVGTVYVGDLLAICDVVLAMEPNGANVDQASRLDSALSGS